MRSICKMIGSVDCALPGWSSWPSFRISEPVPVATWLILLRTSHLLTPDSVSRVAIRRLASTGIRSTTCTVYGDDSSTMNQTNSFKSDPIEIRSGCKRVRAASKRGQSLIEFTLVMPILLLTMTGMLSFGFALHNYLVLTNGVTAGAQLLAISRGQTTDPCATASGAVKSAALGLTTANLSFTFVINGTSYTTTSCTAAAANMVQGASAAVAATYPCTLAVLGMNFSACTLQMETVELIQ
jgi:Flp pilus assembly protein TadG